MQIDQPRYVFVCLRKHAQLAVRSTQQRVTGLLSVLHGRDERLSPIGGEDYEVWNPERRPAGHNFALKIVPPLDVCGPANVTNGVHRPTHQPNAWVAGLGDARPTLTLAWPQPQPLGRIELFFDVDSDHALETVLWGHPERDIPFCVKHYRITDAAGRVVAEVADNHQARNVIALEPPVVTDRLTIELLASHGPVPAALFAVRGYAPEA